jgi:thiamine-monophosphate kinase
MHKLTGENRIIEMLQSRYSSVDRLLKKGIGDDAAVIHPGPADEYWSITTDILAEYVDFRREWTNPACLGFKSLSVNLSDLAAMGARPRFFTVSLALPSDLSPERWSLQFYRGMAELAHSQGALLIGGDLSRSESGITVSITALGESLNRKVLYRSGGRPGHRLYVTGVLGKSAAGLQLLKAGCIHPRRALQKEAVRAHLRPEPRCAAGVWLAQSGLVSCMMDISDGLSMDLARLCRASNVGAEIDAASVPLFPQSSSWNCDPLALALHGGEDFELLFAVPPSETENLDRSYPAAFPPLSRIGQLTQDRRIMITESGKRPHTLLQKGYDHFPRKTHARTSETLTFFRQKSSKLDSE